MTARSPRNPPRPRRSRRRRITTWAVALSAVAVAPLVLLEAALLVKVLLTSPGAKSMTVHWGRTLEPPAIGSIYVRGIVLT